MKQKVATLEQILDLIHDGQTIMFGDLHGEYAAEEIITGMIEKGVTNITAVGVSAGQPDMGVGRLITNHQVSKILTSHIGLNPVAKDQMLSLIHI